MTHKRSPDGRQTQETRHVLYESEADRRFYKKMKAKDVARAIIKDNGTRDLLTGEISYNPAAEKQTRGSLKKTEYRFEEADAIQPSEKYARHVAPRTHYRWVRIEERTINDALACREECEVLNRAYEPCWWR